MGRLILRQAVLDHRVSDLLGAPDPGRSGAEDSDALLVQRRSGRLRTRQDGGERDGAGALHVVVEGADRGAVAPQDPSGVVSAQILPVQQRAGECGGRCLHERVNEGVVACFANAGMPVADVEGVVEECSVVRAGVEHDRHDSIGVDPRRGGIDGELADRDRDPARTPVADAEDALAVDHYNEIHIVGTESVVA